MAGRRGEGVRNRGLPISRAEASVFCEARVRDAVLSRRASAASACWAAPGRGLLVEFLGLFVGPRGTQRFAAKNLDGSRSDNRANRLPTRTRLERPRGGRAA